MRPDRQQRQRSQRDGIARARMFIKSDLAWLTGAPLQQNGNQVEWIVPPRIGAPLGETILVDRERIRRTEFTLNKLVHRFPIALPRIAQDVAAWERRFRRLLEVLKGAVHNGAPLAESGFAVADTVPLTVIKSVNAVEHDHPNLVNLIKTLSWMTLAEPAIGERKLRWFIEQADGLAILPDNLGAAEAFRVSLLLADLAQHDGQEHLAPLLRLLADPQTHAIPTTPASEYREQWTSYFRKKWKYGSKPPPAPELGNTGIVSKLLKFLDNVAAEPPRCRLSAWRVFAIAFPQHCLDPHAASWMQLRELVRTSVRRMRKSTAVDRNAVRVARAEVLAEWDAFDDGGLRALNMQSVLDDVLQAAKHPQLAAPLLELLQFFPQGESGRMVHATLLQSISRAARYPVMHEGRRNWLKEFLQAWRPFLRRYAESPLLLKPWSALLNQSRQPSYADQPEDLFAHAEGLHWPTFVKVVTELVQRVEYTPDSHDLLLALVRATQDAGRTVQLFAELADSGQLQSLLERYISDETFACAVQLSNEQVGISQVLPSLLDERLHPIAAEETHGLSGLLRVDEKLVAAGWNGLLARMLVRERYEVVEGVYFGLLLLEQRGGSALPPQRIQQHCSFCARYPDTFHDALQLLSGCSPAAASVADRILGKWFPDPAKLHGEIEFITARVQDEPENEHLAARLRNLQEREARPTELSPARQTRLHKKLAEATDYEVLRIWQEDVMARQLEVLNEILQVSVVPESIRSRRGTRVVRAILGLKPAFRRLGISCLQATCRADTAWPQIEAANCRFLEELSRRGINTGPWVSPPAPQKLMCANGEAVWIGLELDPFETLCMGLHFQTCLSPGSFNFFSAVTNAVDANKRVLFARDKTGRVVGRCLLAIGDSGALLTFHAYCHEPELQFQEIVAKTAAALASEMKTVVTTTDDVSALVAPEWYDDGSTDFGGTVTSADSPIRTALVNAAPATVLERLNAALAPEGLTVVTLPFVLQMRELHEHPELVSSLLPLIEEMPAEDLPDWALINAALLAAAVDRHDFAEHTIRKHGPRWLQKNPWAEQRRAVLSLLIHYSPTLAIRVMRSSRGKSIRSDVDDDLNRGMLARAFEALGRHKLAQRIRGR